MRRMKRALVLVISMILALVLVGAVSQPLLAQETQTASNQIFRLGTGMGLNMGLSGASYLALSGMGEFSLPNKSLYTSANIVWEGVDNGFVIAFPIEETFFLYKVDFLGQEIQIGPGLGFTMTYNTSSGGFGFTLGDYLISLQGKWEVQVDKLPVFFKGGPFMLIGSRIFGLTLQIGVWLW